MRIQIPTTQEAFDRLVSKTSKRLGSYTITRYQDLEEELGPKWYMRVINRNGDFSFAKLETVNFRLVQPRKLLEYEPVVKDGAMILEPAYIEQSLNIIFSFVRCDGTRAELEHFL